jgi:hypothetical protein
MAFLIILLQIFCRIVRVRDRSNRNITVLQNFFPVNLHDWMTDNQIDKADARIVLPNVIPFPMPRCGVPNSRS